GIMTAVVRAACQFAFREFGLVKIIAHVLPHNGGSARVLEKCGFAAEGYLRQHFRKDDAYLDARLYALFKGGAQVGPGANRVSGGSARPESTARTVGQAYLAEGRRRLAACHARIQHCLGQLDDRQVWWRPQEAMNSIGNLLLHLCGNVRQWLVA